MEIKEIRGKSDIKKVIDLFILVFSEPPYNETWDSRLVFDRLYSIYQSGKGFCFYVEDNKKVLGAIFCHKQVWDDGYHVFIEDTFVDINHRGKGIGKKLVNYLEIVAKKKGISSIEFLTHVKSKAPKFWQKLNYKKTDYLHMSKDL